VHRSDKFLAMATRTRQEYLKDLAQNYVSPTPVDSGSRLGTLISSLPNLFISTPRICNFILLFIVLVHSFHKMLPSVKFAEDKVLVFVILR